MTVAGNADALKWPQAGDDVPVRVDRADPQHVLIRWDQVQTRSQRGLAEAQQIADGLGATGGGGQWSARQAGDDGTGAGQLH